MAQERIVSPGVVARENDQTFLQPGLSNTGAVFIGPTAKGPAFTPTIVKNGLNEFNELFGEDATSTYIPYTVKYYLEHAASVTIMRVLGNGGWKFTTSAGDGLAALVESGSNKILTVFHPSKNASTLGLGYSTMSPSSAFVTNSFILSFSGSGFSATSDYSASLVNTRTNYVMRSVGMNADNSISGSTYEETAFPYLNFKNYQASLNSGSEVIMAISDGDMFFTSSIDGTIYGEGYAAAMSPMITDGDINSPKNLFRFVHRSHGFSTNRDVYVSITGLQEPADVDGIEQYSIFTVLVRRVGDSDKNPVILEQFTNVNLDPNDVNFIARVIGDRYFEYDSNLGKAVVRGNYANKSNYIRVAMSDNFDAALTVSSLSPKASPRGFAALYDTITGFAGYYLPSASMKTVQTLDNFYSTRAYLGFDWTDLDNYNFLNPVPVSGSINGAASTGLNASFTVDSLSGHPSASFTGVLSASVDLGGATGPLPSQLQFSVPLQGGSDGISFATIRNMGSNITATNAFGYDLSAISTAGGAGYKKAIDIMSNAEEYDINVIAMPGVLHDLHPAITSYAIDMVETRGDAVYIMDNNEQNDSIVQALDALSNNPIDSNYAATYYPWVKIADANNNRPVAVPPSVVMPSVYAYTDKVAAPWMVPAGFRRGSLSMVLDTLNKLTKAERDTLYEGRINSIATFPSQGVVAYGQKTLQVKSSALDRLNVRRLMIELKRFIKNAGNNLVFENNTTQTRNQFLAQVNPYLESVQQRQGVYAYRVQMDGSNNTSDTIDRNQLIGAIYVQPTRAIEFVILDFNIVPTGTSFGA